MSNYSRRIVYLSEQQKTELFTNHTITVNGTTITYNENDIYVTPQEQPYIKPVNGIPASDLATGVVNVNDVQINGTSIVNNGTVNIPIATTSVYGVVQPTGALYINANNKLAIDTGSLAMFKAGTSLTAVTTPQSQHWSVFYGLAKAAGYDEKDSIESVGTYTDDAKAAIQNMLGITDLLSTEESSTATAAHALNSTFMMNGKLYKATAAIVIGDAVVEDQNCEVVKADEVFVKNTDYAAVNKYGLIKLGDNSTGLGIRSDGSLGIYPATEQNIKTGTSVSLALMPETAHYTVFYGLSKAAGVDLKDETVTSGTYPETSKNAINAMLGSVSKDSVDYAGITARTYTEKFGGEFSVTTATTSGWNNPYARASVTGRIDKHHMHRVTINGTEYILRARLWYSASNGNIKVYEYLGNLGLYISSTSGMPGGTDDVPFVIISDLNNSNSIDVLTSTAGAYTIKVEEINETKKELPKSLIYGDSYVPIEKNNNGGTYNGTSIGVNNLTDSRGTVAIGYGNTVGAEFSIALGEANTVSVRSSYVEGSGNEASPFASMAHSNHIEGYLNKFTNLGICNHIEGMNSTGTAMVSNTHIEGGVHTISSAISFAHIEGFNNNVKGSNAHVEGAYNVLNGAYTHIQGTYNVPDTIFSTWVANTEYHAGDCVYKYYVDKNTPYGSFICIEDNTDSTFVASKWKQLLGDSDASMIIGNGTADNARSNAFKVDWLGNTYISGNIYVNCNPDSTGGTMLPTDIQIDGTSIVNNGVAEIPLANSSSAGVAKVSASYGVSISDGTLTSARANGDQIKAGSNDYREIVPSNQHSAAFYGLAKAAGDSTQSASDNTVGTYTESAKTAIRSMIGATSSNIVAVQDTQPVEADAKIWMMETAPGSVQVPTMEDMEDYVKKTDYATSSVPGLVKNGTGIALEAGTGKLYIDNASEVQIKGGSTSGMAITPIRQHMAVFYGLAKAAGDTTQAASDNAVGTYTTTASAAIRSMLGVVGDVQVNGNSIVSNGIATIPLAQNSSTAAPGLVKINWGGLQINSSGFLQINPATSSEIKAATASYVTICPARQHESVFYGLAKAGGDTTMASSSNAVGTYTTEAKAAIRNMLGIETSIELIETISGATPAIVGQPNVTYQCEEVSTISIIPPANGTIDVYFTSGSTAAVLTAPSTIKWPAWFDVEALEPNTIYELMITNGTYGSVMTWAT